MPSTSLHGSSVGVLMILRPKDSRNERYVILTEQSRIGKGSTLFPEIPTGVLDSKSGHVKGKEMDKIYEETSLKVRGEEVIDMTALALVLEKTRTKGPANGFIPANLDKHVPLLLWEKDLDRKDIEALKGKIAGKRAKDELITLRIRDYEALWRASARDTKAAAAWALYEGLNRAGKIEEQLHDIRMGH